MISNKLELHYESERAEDLLAVHLSRILENDKIVIICIGTDRSTGDSLGPLVGTMLSQSSIKDKVVIMGTLEYPVHAKNLERTIEEINEKYKDYTVIAIDACLGNRDSIGNIIVNDKPLYPGAAMDKALPPVGDISITGIINISGSLEFMIIQNTRLYIVNGLVKAIANIVENAINRYHRKRFGNPEIINKVAATKECSVLSFEEPKKLRETTEHNNMYVSDSGVAGTYVPNMSEEDRLKWKAKHIKGENERVEIRKGFKGTQVVIIVYKDEHIQMSANNKIHMDFTEFNKLKIAINEAKHLMGV
jgi:putative sporulation protein YyaC